MERAMSEEREQAKKFAEDALVLHWQPRLKAERGHRAPWDQVTTVKDCYEHGFLAGVEWARKQVATESRKTRSVEEG